MSSVVAAPEAAQLSAASRRWPLRGDKLREHGWIGALVAGGALAVLYLAGTPLSSGLTFNLFGVASVVAILAASRRHGAVRRPLLFIAGAQLLSAVGDDLVGGLRLAMYPLLIAGLLVLIRARTPAQDRASLIDTLIVSTAAGVLSWTLLIAPHFYDGAVPTATTLTSIAYLVLDLAVLACLLRLALAPSRGGPFYLLISALGSVLATDTAHGWLLLHGGYQTGGLLDAGWLAFSVLAAATALHPQLPQLVEPAPQAGLRLSPRRIAGLAVASLAAPAVLLGQSLTGHTRDVPLLAGCAAAAFALVILRLVDLVKRHDAMAETLLERRTEARFQSLVQNATDVIVVVDAEGRIGFASPAATRIFGFQPAQLVGRRFVSIVSTPDRMRVAHAILADAPAGIGESTEFELVTPRGNVEVEATCTNLLDDANVGGIVLTVRDITERKGFERQLAHQAFHDEVTGLANRVLFRERVEHALERTRRATLPLVVMFLDVDDFKAVNDTLGHNAGDELLRTIAARVSGELRSGDTAARLGGDEFAILIEECDFTDAAQIAERLLEALAAPADLQGKEFSITASIGIAVLGAARDVSADNLIHQADVAMYAAKQAGKGGYKLFEPEMHAAVIERLELKRALQVALENDEFELHYQPIVDLKSGAIEFVETLLRWRHPERGLVSPAQFIPLAEETGLIVPIGSWVLEHAVGQAVRMMRFIGPNAPAVSINLSARQLQQPEFAEEVKALLHRTGVPRDKVILEITETAMMEDIDFAVARLHELKAQQIRLAVDDFGSGYSSLNYIRKLPVDILKIDRSFVADVAKPGELSSLTQTIVELASILKMVPVAEGIEDEGQLRALRQMGCALGQGFLFTRPLDVRSLETVVLNDVSRRLAA